MYKDTCTYKKTALKGGRVDSPLFDSASFCSACNFFFFPSFFFYFLAGSERRDWLIDSGRNRQSQSPMLQWTWSHPSAIFSPPKHSTINAGQDKGCAFCDKFASDLFCTQPLGDRKTEQEKEIRQADKDWAREVRQAEQERERERERERSQPCRPGMGARTSQGRARMEAKNSLPKGGTEWLK